MRRSKQKQVRLYMWSTGTSIPSSFEVIKIKDDIKMKAVLRLLLRYSGWTRSFDMGR